MSDYDSPNAPRPRRRLAPSWWFSAVLVIALLAALGTVLYATLANHPHVSGTVVDAYTLSPVAGAAVSAGVATATTNDQGGFTLKGNTKSVSAAKTGYETANATVAPDAGSLRVFIRPDVLAGTVVSSADHLPIRDASVMLRTGSSVVGSTRTDSAGTFTLKDVPENANVEISAPDFATLTQPIGQNSTIDVQLHPNVLTGVVTDQQGNPITDALVAFGDKFTTTSSDGVYRLQPTENSGTIYFKAPGFAEVSKPINATMKVSASLSSLQVNAIYASAASVSNKQTLDSLIKIADTSEVNAIVVDLKDSTGHVYYSSNVPLAQEIGAVSPLLDPTTLVETLHQHHLYAIARIVVFEDPILAEARPAWAIHDSSTGGLWHTWNGLAWVNAYRSEVWNYNVAIAKEAAAFGFDEIQLDYIRFPTDGPLDTADYGQTNNQQNRTQAIDAFLDEMHAAIAPTHAYLAADVFGLTLWETGDGGIGQNLEQIAKRVDYVCPMLYPSHFADGSMGFAVPNDHPYEVVLWSLENASQRISQSSAKLRPWLQDFSLGQGIAYGPTQVKQQIQAAHDSGTSGWMMWNAGSEYDSNAFVANGST